MSDVPQAVNTRMVFNLKKNPEKNPLQTDDVMPNLHV